MSKFKVGDIVSPYDGSYSVGADNKGFAHKCGIEMKDRKFKVVDTGLRVTPMDYDRKFHAGDTRSDGTPAYPDMLIQALDNGEYVFVISDFVKKIPQPVPFMDAVNSGKRIRPDSAGYPFDRPQKYLSLMDDGYDMGENWLKYINGQWFIEE